jgi:hypothetical protein
MHDQVASFHFKVDRQTQTAKGSQYALVNYGCSLAEYVIDLFCCMPAASDALLTDLRQFGRTSWICPNPDMLLASTRCFRLQGSHNSVLCQQCSPEGSLLMGLQLLWFQSLSGNSEPLPQVSDSLPSLSCTSLIVPGANLLR